MSGILQTFAYGRAFSTTPANTVAPVVSGTATVGQTLSTTNGTWSGIPTPTFTYQWQRAGSNIGSATSSTYLLVAADVGSAIRCVVTATNVAGSSSANSNATAAVAATVPGAPTIGTATATSSTTATVAYTAPASNGGATITLYTATSSPSNITGTLATAGSGTITVSGLAAGTSYSFTVKATNSAGQSAASGASNTITTVPAIGAAYGGGFFAGQIGVSSVATHNLVVSPRSTGQISGEWKTTLTNTPGSSSVINGPANTAAQVADGSAAVYVAAHFCNNLVTGGQSDWYFGATNEMAVCYVNLKPNTQTNNTSSGINPNAVPARTTNYPSASDPVQTSVAAFQSPSGAERFTADSYWSSTQFNSARGAGIAFSTGQYFNQYKYASSNLVRAIRRVAV
jgi:hypothetical protein